MRRLDHVANRTGKPARSLPDGKQMKWVSTGETGPKLRTTSPQPGSKHPTGSRTNVSSDISPLIKSDRSMESTRYSARSRKNSLYVAYLRRSQRFINGLIYHEERD
jgi:hypothetical protein